MSFDDPVLVTTRFPKNRIASLDGDFTDAFFNEVLSSTADALLSNVLPLVDGRLLEAWDITPDSSLDSFCLRP